MKWEERPFKDEAVFFDEQTDRIVGHVCRAGHSRNSDWYANLDGPLGTYRTQEAAKRAVEAAFANQGTGIERL